MDHSNRFAVDALLRDNGYVIYKRTSKGQPLWLKQGRVFSQQEALDQLDQDALWNAEYAEKLYWDGLPSSIDLGGCT